MWRIFCAFHIYKILRSFFSFNHISLLPLFKIQLMGSSNKLAVFYREYPRNQKVSDIKLVLLVKKWFGIFKISIFQLTFTRVKSTIETPERRHCGLALCLLQWEPSLPVWLHKFTLILSFLFKIIENLESITKKSFPGLC